MDDGTAVRESNASQGEPPHRYSSRLAAQIEARWQERWESEGTFEAPNPVGSLSAAEHSVAREKFYVLDMFPYPSDATLHVGHPLGYLATDVVGRFKRMTGHNVLHTMGFDAFGLPAEQYAVQTGRHPRETTEANIAQMRQQLRQLGLAYDQRRSVATTDEAFYRWTQWMFVQMFNAYYDRDAGRARPISELVDEFEAGRQVPGYEGSWADLGELERRSILDEHRLAYLDDAPVNWCPGLGTVLADEEVTSEGRSERGNFPVFRRSLRQWKLRITAFADRLLEDLDLLDWPESIKVMQRNWIGRSIGASVEFQVRGAEQSISVFTTRPDTLFGSTFLVLSPEHPLLDEVVPALWPQSDLPDSWTMHLPTPREALSAYRDLIRDGNGGDGTSGVFSGLFVNHPVTGSPLPVFVADYVIAGYGTGAIMAVPAHDDRDLVFAKRLDLPTPIVVSPPKDWVSDPGQWREAWSGDGTLVNSTHGNLALDGLESGEAAERVVSWLEANELGGARISYRLRDWLFSRQRYWGEPFPIVYDEHGLPIVLPDHLLPVVLPDVTDFSPVTFDPEDAMNEPVAPLARANDWVEVTLDLGEGPMHYRRETNTMPQWAGSCWYFLRYLDPSNEECFCDAEVERYWMGPNDPSDSGGVDLYVGGVEHAVLHLLYARFWHKVLFDLGHVSSREPFRRLVNQGYVQAWAYADGRGAYVPADEVTERDGAYFWRDERVSRRFGKMGKSLKNALTPDELCQLYGADTLRLYEMSMAPIEASRPWETRAVVGPFRFLQRLWRNIIDEDTGEASVSREEADETTRRLLHRTVAAVRDDYESFRLNTVVARLTELNNHLTKELGGSGVPREIAEPLVLMLAPLAPHVGEELWRRLGHGGTLAYEPFPEADPDLLRDQLVTCVVQVDGKLRDRIEVVSTAGEDVLRNLAMASERVRVAINQRPIERLVIVPPRLVNIVLA